MSTTTRDILVVGATGQQGSAVISALAERLNKSDGPGHPIRILALTRSKSSSKAQALAAKFTALELVEGDVRNPEPIFEEYPRIASIFLVTVPPDEIAQASPLINTATQPGRYVDHILFTSVDRGGESVSWTEPTPIPHFAAKLSIEQHLLTACKEANENEDGIVINDSGSSLNERKKKVRWTILRPTGFMDNYNPGFFGSLMMAMWRQGVPNDQKLQLISTADIGKAAAAALLNPDAWDGKAVGLAGDELSFTEATEIFRKAIGTEAPEANWLIARAALWFIQEARVTFKWYETGGFRVEESPLLMEEGVKLQSFETWLKENSKWKTSSE